MAEDFAGRVVVITGAAGNLGQAVAQAFAASGATLVLLDLDPAALRAAHAARGDALLLPIDILDRAAMRDAAAAVLRQRGRVDVLCNLVGGFTMGHPVHDTPPDVWQRMLDLNVGSLLNASAAFVPAMIAARGGRVVNVAAGAALRGAAEMGAYGASKSAVVRLTESMSAELRGHNINVNCVMPGTMDTPQNRAAMPGADPAGWVGPDEVAEAIRFLGSDAARGVHGAALPVPGRN